MTTTIRYGRFRSLPKGFEWARSDSNARPTGLSPWYEPVALTRLPSRLATSELRARLGRVTAVALISEYRVRVSCSARECIAKS